MSPARHPVLTRSIEAPPALIALIEVARSRLGLGFEVPESEILMRLLRETESNGLRQGGKEAWVDGGVSLPAETRLRMRYKSKLHYAVIRSGLIVLLDDVDGRPKKGANPQKSLSGAAKEVVRLFNGKDVSLDGWNYWFVMRPNDSDWVLANVLRK